MCRMGNSCNFEQIQRIFNRTMCSVLKKHFMIVHWLAFEEKNQWIMSAWLWNLQTQTCLINLSIKILKLCAHWKAMGALTIFNTLALGLRNWEYSFKCMVKSIVLKKISLSLFICPLWTSFLQYHRVFRTLSNSKHSDVSLLKLSKTHPLWWWSWHEQGCTRRSSLHPSWRT